MLRCRYRVFLFAKLLIGIVCMKWSLQLATHLMDRQPTDGKLFGYNTDYIGAISSTETGLRGFENGASGSPLASKLFVVIGAGSVGKALAFGANEKGARVVNANHNYGEQNQGTSPRQKHNSNTH